jgi:hypothetical protein
MLNLGVNAMKTTNELVEQHNLAAQAIADSYEKSAKRAQRCLDIVRDGRSKAKYRRQIERFTRAAEEARRMIIVGR